MLILNFLLIIGTILFVYLSIKLINKISKVIPLSEDKNITTCDYSTVNMQEVFEKYISDQNSTNNTSTNRNLEEEIKLAKEIRNFEIELYWKRSNYFWIITAAMFVAFASIITKSDTSITINSNITLLYLQYAICFLGGIISWSWYLSCRGSKYWQENWENMLTSLYNANNQVSIFDYWLKPTTSITSINQAFPFSVSKTNQIMSFIVFLTWSLLLIILIAIDIYNKYPETLFNLQENAYLTLYISLFVLYLFTISTITYYSCNFMIQAIINQTLKLESTKTTNFITYKNERLK